MAIVEGQKAILRWSNRNATYYLKLGYPRLEQGDQFEVPLEHLTKGSNALVQLKCDSCLISFHKKYSAILKTKNHFCSRKCQDNFLVGKPTWNSRKIMINCSFCNIKIERSEWELKRSKNLFCSKSCSDKHMKEYGKGRPKVKRVKLNCTQCNDAVERTESEIKRARNHFCSKTCSDIYSKNNPNLKSRNGKTVTCYTCSNEFYLPKKRIESQNRHFCSNGCRKAWMKLEEFSILMTRESTLIKLSCKTCKQTLYRKPAEYKSNATGNFYCSVTCKNKDMTNWNLPQLQKGEKVEVHCYSCRKEKLVQPSVFKKNKYFFCSFQCYQNKRLEITDGKLTATSIHLKVNEFLKEMGIDYIDEQVFSYYSTDIYIPSLHLAIEVSGDYWHSNPNIYSNINNLNETQLKGIRKDYFKHQTLTKRHKLKVLYMWENEINKDEDLCKLLLERFIANSGSIEDYNSFNYINSNGTLLIKETQIDPYFLSFQLSNY